VTNGLTVTRSTWPCRGADQATWGAEPLSQRHRVQLHRGRAQLNSGTPSSAQHSRRRAAASGDVNLDWSGFNGTPYAPAAAGSISADRQEAEKPSKRVPDQRYLRNPQVRINVEDTRPGGFHQRRREGSGALLMPIETVMTVGRSGPEPRLVGHGQGHAIRVLRRTDGKEQVFVVDWKASSKREKRQGGDNSLNWSPATMFLCPNV